MTTKCLLCHVEDVAYSPSKLEPVGDDAPLDLQKTACNRCGVRYHFGGTLLGTRIRKESRDKLLQTVRSANKDNVEIAVFNFNGDDAIAKRHVDGKWIF